MASNTAHPAPAQVRPKVGPRKTVDKKLERSASYLAAQAEGDPANKLGPIAAALSAAHQDLTAKLGLKVTLQAQVDMNNAAIVSATRRLDVATVDYARGAARLADTDAVVLGALGVAAAKKSGPKGARKVPEAPALLVISTGASPGEALLKCRKVAYAGSYVFEYKLEPSQPADPWLPGGGIQTMLVSATVSGLAPSQQIRARVRAVGAMSSAWSEEVVGRAR
jgi:hypothetical protein